MGGYRYGQIHATCRHAASDSVLHLQKKRERKECGDGGGASATGIEHWNNFSRIFGSTENNRPVPGGSACPEHCVDHPRI